MHCFHFSSIVVFFLCLELKVGQYVTSAVEEVKNGGRVVRLSVSRLNSSQTCAQSSQGWNLTNLLPGLLVNATIKKVQKTFFKKCHLLFINIVVYLCMTNVWSVVLILQVTKHGLILDFLSSFTGQVDFLHMEPEQTSSYKEGNEVKLFFFCCCFLCVN